MVSDAKKKKAASKKAGNKVASKSTAGTLSNASKEATPNASTDALAALDLNGTNGAEEISDRTVTGVLTSHPQSRDVHIESVTLLFHGHQLLEDTAIELNHGRRYGLLGPNGCGKSCLLKAISARELPIPDHVDIYHLAREMEASDKTALEAVMSVNEEKLRLEAKAEQLNTMEGPEVEQLLIDIYEKLDLLDSDKTEARAASLLHGLGFTKEMQAKKTRDFSGGWRMRIALARALFTPTDLLLLDEPTNHLDLEACVWLEETLKSYPSILLMVSHSQDFLNGVCNNIIYMGQKKLTYYSGNYDTYVQTRADREQEQMKRYQWEQDQIAHMKRVTKRSDTFLLAYGHAVFEPQEYIARFGHGSAKLARQAQSKEKTLSKMVEGGLTQRVAAEKVVRLRFQDTVKLPPPVLQFTKVTFGYSPDKILYRDVDFGVDLDSRIALVGPNGAGKSTLLKLMTGALEPLDGMVKRHNHLKIGQYHQHLMELLDAEATPLQYMMAKFPEIPLDKMRSVVGRFGISGAAQTLKIKHLSDGLKSRVCFAEIAENHPSMLLLDEPTNHLDIETIDSLARAINEWNGGLVLVSHDFRLISQVAHEIYEVNKGVHRFQGDIIDFKEHLRKTHAALADK